VKLPEHAQRQPQRPNLPGKGGFRHGSGNRPTQRDAERRAGKSRKVH